LDGLEGAHFEVRRGTQQQAADYCRKKDASYVEGPWEFGAPSDGQGSRVDLDKLKSDIDRGDGMMEICENHFSAFLRYGPAIQRYMALKQPARVTKPIVKWICGPPGTGKSHHAHSEAVRGCFDKGKHNWWDGYDPDRHDVVELADFKGSIPFHELLQLLDRYDYLGQVKGGFVRIAPRTIFITTNARPDQIYKDPSLSWEALSRRVDWWGWKDSLNAEIQWFSEYSKFVTSCFNVFDLSDNNNMQE